VRVEEVMTEEQTVSIMAAIIAAGRGYSAAIATDIAWQLRAEIREQFARTEALATDKQRAAGSAP
jgi:hypothetical protein